MTATGQAPKGPTQVRWFSEGYQAALRDLASALDVGGVAAVREWIENNRTKS